MKNIIIDLLGFLGVGTAISVPFMQKITVIGQFIAVFLGILLAILSIIHKYIQIKESQKKDKPKADDKFPEH